MLENRRVARLINGALWRYVCNVLPIVALPLQKVWGIEVKSELGRLANNLIELVGSLLTDLCLFLVAPLGGQARLGVSRSRRRRGSRGRRRVHRDLSEDGAHLPVPVPVPVPVLRRHLLGAMVAKRRERLRNRRRRSRRGQRLPGGHRE